jgi:NAD(P)-dependent dehydrogenase (short-subunit alcohol dehydrogenase family)
MVPLRRAGEVKMGAVSFDFSGEVVVISGAARGIGRETARRFAGAGAQVAAVDIDAEGLAGTAELAGDSVITETVDIRDADRVRELMETIGRRFGRLDVLVNNAAVAPRAALREYPEQLWESVYDINCKGTFLMTRAAAGLMIDRGVPGRIVNLSSGAALKGGHGSAAYASSRAAVESFSRVAAMELAPYGILVNTLRLGLFDTQPKPLPSRMKEQLEARIPALPLRRPGSPEEAAGAAMFLASGLASYMTGAVMTVDGGSSAGSYSDAPVTDDDTRYFWLPGSRGLR